jgi:hypothetical protein
VGQELSQVCSPKLNRAFLVEGTQRTFEGRRHLSRANSLRYWITVLVQQKCRYVAIGIACVTLRQLLRQERTWPHLEWLHLQQRKGNESGEISRTRPREGRQLCGKQATCKKKRELSRKGSIEGLLRAEATPVLIEVYDYEDAPRLRDLRLPLAGCDPSHTL